MLANLNDLANSLSWALRISQLELVQEELVVPIHLVAQIQDIGSCILQTFQNRRKHRVSISQSFAPLKTKSDLNTVRNLRP